ncbi:hypothetical protein Hypma_006426 [Hypsizygus marmoreus]|uniref:Uncharacterized protein n=1 Tax=Hypsizygus marmoreus TaxID=39966 RepID=A0A369K0Y2_HYPMA|nr:hypothetical protein Hypma_006426 [Hypsizygus marmoreus]
MSSAVVSTVSSNAVDIEAQTSLPTPTPVLTYITRSPPAHTTATRSPLDDFFGHTLSSSRTHESRHDLSLADVPPPYVDDLPPYSRKAPEPVTLAQYLFKFGFLFPPFWIMGAWILWSPLRAPNDSSDAELGWMPEKTPAERNKIIEEMRAVEVKWALRCLYALLMLVLLAALGGIAAWTLTRS